MDNQRKTERYTQQYGEAKKADEGEREKNKDIISLLYLFLVDLWFLPHAQSTWVGSGPHESKQKSIHSLGVFLKLLHYNQDLKCIRFTQQV